MRSRADLELTGRLSSPVKFARDLTVAATVALCLAALGDDERQVRERYERILIQNPFQERAFQQVFESYLQAEGVNQWIERLKSQSQPTNIAAFLLLGQIYDRQFQSSNAIASLEKAAELGESRPEFKALLGSLYYKAGRDDRATDLLASSLDELTDLDRRASVCRMLGNLFLRQNKREEAIKVWKRIAGQSSDEIFSQLELAEIYEDNRLWDEAIDVYRRIATAAGDDPYRRCRALRSVGQCLVQMEKHRDAIAVYEEALALMLPGSWLFEDLKARLVNAYEDTGDLAGLVKYLQARLDQAPGAMEFRELLAEIHGRMGQPALAEQQYKQILDRNPRNSFTYEKLLGLYLGTEQKTNAVATLEKLIELFPADTDYLRRLGEFHLRDRQPEKAKATWRRVAATVRSREASETSARDLTVAATPEKLALLAGWFESYEFVDDAIPMYEQAIEKTRNKDWIFRLAALKHQKGDETTALKLWLSVIDPATSKVGDYVELASILEAHKEIEEAARLRKQAAALEPGNLEHRLAYARDLMQLEKFDAALAEYTTLADQAQTEFLKLQGESGQLDAYTELGLLDGKRQEWERALERDPRSVEIMVRLARVYERTGQRDKALQLHERRRDFHPDDIEALRALGAAYKTARKHQQATDAFRRLLEKDKPRARVYYKELLDIHLAAESKDEAIDAAERLVALAPSDAEAHIDLARVYFLFGAREKSFEQYRHALRLAPNDPEYHRVYGEALIEEKRWGEAQAAFRKMLDLAQEDQTRLHAVQSLTRIHQQQSGPEELIAEFNRRVRNTPKKLAAYEDLAAIYRELGQNARAMETLENGLQTVDDKASALKNLIRVASEARNLPKVRTYFEQLIALSGKPSLAEYERLASLYAYLGEADKAKATWDRMLELAPRDVKWIKRVSATMREEGFAAEALALKAKALELAPDDARLRFEYAQMLASIDQPAQALEQLQKLLDLAGRESSESADNDKTRRTRQLARGPRAKPNPFTQVQNAARRLNSTASSSSLTLSSFSGMSLATASWQGDFADFKPQIIAFMARLSRNAGGVDDFVQSCRNRVVKSPGNLEFKRELLLVYLALDWREESFRLAEEILAGAPDDLDVMELLAMHYSAQGPSARSIPLLEKLAATNGRYQLSARLSLVRLYFQQKESEKALNLAAHLLTERPPDTTILSLGSLMIGEGQTNFAMSVYEHGLTLNSRYHKSFQTSLAGLYRRSGDIEKAAGIYKDMLFAETPATVGSGAMNLYQPQPASTLIIGGVRGRRMPQGVLGDVDVSTNSPLAHLRTLWQSRQTSNDPMAELESAARKFSPTMSPPERTRAWQAARILFAHYFFKEDYGSAGNLLTDLREAGKEDIEWFNVAIYFNQMRSNYNGMIAFYDEVAERHSARRRETLIAQTKTYNMARNFEAAATSIRELNQQSLAPSEFMQLILPISNGGAKALAKPLLEEYLAKGPRDGAVLVSLARIYAGERNYERAIDLAGEALDRRPQSRTPGAAGSGRRIIRTTTSVSVSSSASVEDSLIRDLYNYHSSAGRTAELIEKFTRRLARQPNSFQLQEYLAQIYSLNGRRDEALEMYQQLAKRFPHVVQYKMDVARALTDKAEYARAIDIYQKLLQSNPEMSAQINPLLQGLAQRVKR